MRYILTILFTLALSFSIDAGPFGFFGRSNSSCGSAATSCGTAAACVPAATCSVPAGGTVGSCAPAVSSAGAVIGAAPASPVAVTICGDNAQPDGMPMLLSFGGARYKLMPSEGVNIPDPATSPYICVEGLVSYSTKPPTIVARKITSASSERRAAVTVDTSATSVSVEVDRTRRWHPIARVQRFWQHRRGR